MFCGGQRDEPFFAFLLRDPTKRNRKISPSVINTSYGLKPNYIKPLSLPWRAAGGGRGTPDRAGAGSWWGILWAWCSWGAHSAPPGSTRHCSGALSSRTPSRWPPLCRRPEAASPGSRCFPSGCPGPRLWPGTDRPTLLSDHKGKTRKHMQSVWR